MPFIQEYECFEHHHHFEYMHMGSRDTLPATLACEYVVSGETQYEQSYNGSSMEPELIPVGSKKFICGMPARPVISAPGAIQTIVRGNHDYNARERERLEKRAAAHDRTTNEKDRKRDLLERRLREGYPVNPITGR